METLVIQAKTKKQVVALKAISDAMGMKYRSTEELEKMEDKWMGKLMSERTGEYLTEDEENIFLEQMRKGEFKG